MGFLPLLPSCGKSGKRIINRIFATFAIMWQKWQKDELWDFCHFCHMWQKWQKDELWDFCHFCHHVAKVAKGLIMGFLPLPSCGKSGKRMNYEIFATFAIMWQKWQKDEL